MGILDKIKNVKFKTVTVKADELGEGSELIFRFRVSSGRAS